MARKTHHRLDDKNAEIAELLDEVEALLDRTKVLFEQYFMGIQKLAPMQLHKDIDRKIRELTQMQIRNTALRYRLTNVTQKFGVYNTYWRRTMRQIEQGTYVRDIARASRDAKRRGEDIPEEMLLAMPKRMRDRILRDRELLAKQAEHVAADDGSNQIEESALAQPPAPGPRSNVHRLDAGGLDDDLDIDALFRSLTSEAEQAVDALQAPRSRAASPPVREPVAAPRRPPLPVPMPPPPLVAPPPVPGARPPAAVPRPSAELPPGMTEERVRDLHRRYVAARKQLGEAGDVPYESLVHNLRKQAPRIMEQHNATGVEFDVVVKDNKVLLKAKPKR